MAGRRKTLARRLATLVFLIALIPFAGVTIQHKSNIAPRQGRP